MNTTARPQTETEFRATVRTLVASGARVERLSISKRAVHFADGETTALVRRTIDGYWDVSALGTVR